MGYLRSGVCFPDLSTVKAEHCADTLIGWGYQSYAMSAQCVSTDFSSSSYSVVTKLNGADYQSYTTAYPAFPACSYDGTVNVALEYFGVLLAFLTVVYVATKLKRYFWNDKEGL